MTRYALRSGEYLAISSDAIRRDEGGMFFVMGPPPPDNERLGAVAVVHIRGALAHFCTDDGDSYEAIVRRVGAAMKDEDGDGKLPVAVVLRIESPGGVVAGLNETVKRLRRMSEASGVPLVAYVDEMAASAAYAIACSCSDIIAPPSAVVGSVGVISTIVSQSGADQQMGLDFRLITSGARKADGHLHAPISDAAVRAETERVEELASQFYAIAGAARRMAPAKLAGLQAAIYLGGKARKVGLVDSVMSWEDVLATLQARAEKSLSGPQAVAPGDGNKTDRRAK